MAVTGPFMGKVCIHLLRLCSVATRLHCVRLKDTFDTHLSFDCLTGSYFARDASYSDKYVKSKTVKKKMFLAQVLVGEFTRGQSSLVRPPAKNSNRFFDSCVDNESNPAIFVVFEKFQVYPEYIIEYL